MSRLTGMKTVFHLVAALAGVLIAPGLFAQRVITLEKESLGAARHGFVIDSVIIAFDDTAAIGETRLNLRDRTERMQLAGGAAHQVRSFLQRALIPEKGARHLVLKVDRLTVAEGDFGGMQFASAGVCVEFIAWQGAVPVRVYIHGATAADKALDVTHLHAANLVRALDECLNGYDRAEARSALTERPLTEQQLHRVPPAVELGLPVLSEGKPRSGLYHAFMDMANNAPDTGIPFELEREQEKDGSVSARVRLSSGLDIRNVWGVCENGDVFINNGKRFVLAERDITGFHVTYKGTGPLSDPNANAIVGGLLGGVLFGAMLAAGASSSPVDAVRTYDLDMLTGQLVPRPRDPNAHGAEERSAIVFINAMHDSASVELTLFGGKEATLLNGQHHWVRLIAREAPIVVGISAGASEGPELQVDTRLPNPQVFVITKAPDGKPACTPAAPGTAEKVLAGLERGNEVE